MQRFINIDNTTIDEPVFIAGTATDIYQTDGTTVKTSTINYVAHGKFSKLSLINNEIQAVDDSPDIQKGEQSYMYVDQTGQLKTNSFSELFDNHILNITTSNLNLDITNAELIQKGENNYLYVDIHTGQLKTKDNFKNIELKDYSQNQNVTLTGEQLKQLKELIPLIPQIKKLLSS